MAYLNSDTTYVEIGTKFPFHFRLPKELLGLKNWQIQFLNKDNTNVITIDPSSYDVREVGVFTPLTDLVGEHPMGTSHLTVVDSSTVSVGMTIRISDFVFGVVSIDSANNIVIVDSALPVTLPDASQIKKVEYPNYLGRYWTEIIPDTLGRYKVTMVSEDIKINPIEDDLEIVSSLSYTGGTGIISALSGNNAG